jgi:hypothetical protein
MLKEGNLTSLYTYTPRRRRRLIRLPMLLWKDKPILLRNVTNRKVRTLMHLMVAQMERTSYYVYVLTFFSLIHRPSGTSICWVDSREAKLMKKEIKLLSP